MTLLSSETGMLQVLCPDWKFSKRISLVWIWVSVATCLYWTYKMDFMWLWQENNFLNHHTRRIFYKAHFSCCRHHNFLFSRLHNKRSVTGFLIFFFFVTFQFHFPLKEKRKKKQKKTHQHVPLSSSTIFFLSYLIYFFSTNTCGPDGYQLSFVFSSFSCSSILIDYAHSINIIN